MGGWIDSNPALGGIGAARPHGKLITALCKARRLAESMRNHPLPADLAMPGQIRFRPP